MKTSLSRLDPEVMNKISENCMVAHLGIEYTHADNEKVCAKMPVDNRTNQPMGLLHGGASVALAESIGSTASAMHVDLEKYNVMGLEINANHIKSAKEGWVYATAKPIHMGKRTHIWEIRVVNEYDDLICICRLTNVVVEKA